MKDKFATFARFNGRKVLIIDIVQDWAIIRYLGNVANEPFATKFENLSE